MARHASRNARSAVKIELHWAGKNSRPPRAPMALREDPSRRYPAAPADNGRGLCDNRLIHGDNLPALAALEREFAGAVRCVYIDPPYNTGVSFEHYDDDREHSAWLSWMRDRLQRFHALLRPDGVLLASVDDRECAYLTVLLDEIFGRRNFCGQLVWEKKRKPSFLNANLGGVTEYVLAYAKLRAASPAFVGGRTTPGKMYPLNNAGNGLRVLSFPPGSVRFWCDAASFEPQDMSEGKIITRLLDPVEIRGGTNVGPFRLEGEWRYAQAKLDAVVAAGETIVVRKTPFRPNHVRRGGEPKKLKNLLSIAHGGMSTYEDATEESRSLFGAAGAFDYPKPEKLVATLVAAVTQPGDWVLDAFAGSGTTGAVAHKLKRRWIMIECGEHCHTHIVPRMQKVVDGADPGGVTAETGWRGGGGFRYYTLVHHGEPP
jgi:adenine-specific DNA-methyltransferase